MNYEVNKCPITDSELRFEYLDLGLQPIVNNLNNNIEESLTCPKYPLAIQLFEESKLSSLTYEIDPKILYEYYLYKSGTSQPYIEHCREMFEFVNYYLHLDESDLVLDIGGNDGTLLTTFKQIIPSLNVINIDASYNLTIESNLKGIPSICGFWGTDLAKQVNKKFELITTTNCFQHTAYINDFVEAIKMSLTPRGIWCLEFPYWKNSLETNQFDQIYHEHIYYYLLSPLKLLLDKHGLEIIKAVPYPIHGGTLRILIAHKGTWTPCNSVEQTLEKEKFEKEDYIAWGKRMKEHIIKSRDFLLGLKSQGYKIAGFGAAAKGCIYLNAMGINYEQIDYIIDDTDIKQNKFMPGLGIEVLNREILKTTNPDYILILAHNFADYIMGSLRKDGYKGKFILLIPEIKECE